MDSDLVMSATAGATLREDVLEADYWRAFAPAASAPDMLARISAAVQQPHVSVKSETSQGMGVRARFDGRLGVAGVIDDGEVPVAFPIVREGRALDVEILDVVSGWKGREGWIVAAYQGVRFGFYDALHCAGRKSYRNGEKYRFVVNALALSLNRVEPLFCPADLDGDLLPFSLKDLRAYLPEQTGHDRGILQSSVDGAPQSLVYGDREFICLPVSLGDGVASAATIDLVVSPEIAGSIGRPIRVGEEVAGVVWLQGYAADQLNG